MSNKKEIAKIKARNPVPILILIISFFIIINIIWLTIDTLPPSFDDSIHMRSCLLYARFISKAVSTMDLSQNFPQGIDTRYPPLFYISTLPIVYIFGFVEDYLVFVNFFYLIVLVFSVYGIGKIMFNVRVGIVSSLLTLFYPIMFGLSRRYLLDFALVAMVALVQYLSLKYAIEEKKSWGFLLIMAAIAAVLVKQSSIVFFIPLMIALFSLRGWRKEKLSLIFIIAIFISLCLLFVCYRELIYFWFGDSEGLLTRFAEKFLWYLNTIRHAMLSPNLFLFFLIGFASFLAFDRRWKILLIFASWTIPAFFVICIIKGLDARYLMGFLPAFAIITVGGIDALRRERIRNILLGGVICIGLIQFLNLSFDLKPSLVKEKDFFYNRSPSRKDWKVKDIIDYISRRYGRNNIKIAMLPSCEFFNHDELILYIALKKLPYSVLGLWKPRSIKDHINECDIVITNSPFSSGYYPEENKAKIHERFIEKKLEENSFEVIKKFELPNGVQALLYIKE